mgnify:CR=1 FL=1
MGKEQIKEQIIKKSDVIAEILLKGKKDVELRKSANGVSIAEVSKRCLLYTSPSPRDA